MEKVESSDCRLRREKKKNIAKSFVFAYVYVCDRVKTS